MDVPIFLDAQTEFRDVDTRLEIAKQHMIMQTPADFALLETGERKMPTKPSVSELADFANNNLAQQGATM
jgi:hypothetical protein